MQMFETLLNSIPKNRSQMVNGLEIPEVTLSPYLWTECDDSLSTQSDSVLTGSEDYDTKTYSTDSSLPLSRAMTDSEIDYGRYRRLKSRSLSDPWDQMRAALDAFPRGHLASLNSFQNSTSDVTEDTSTQERLRRFDDELKLKMERFFDEECRVFTPEDPGLFALEDALHSLDLKTLDSDIDNGTTEDASIVP